MRIDAIALETVGVHDDTAVDLPQTGTVVVTGPNGSGKSSYVEAVALALWGESLRGEPIWRQGEGGRVAVKVAVGGRELVVERKRTKAGAKSLSFTLDGAAAVKYETPTKAQEALEELIGTFDSWRRTAVLSSADSAHFSLATDSERKRLLERLLGIDRLDRAANLARGDLRGVETKLQLAQRAKDAAHAAYLTASARVREIGDAIAAAPAAAPEVAEVDYRAALQVAQEELADVRGQLSEAQREVGASLADLRAAHRRVGVCEASTCPTCEQVIPQGLRASVAAQAAAAGARQQQLTAELGARMQLLEATQRELQAEVDRLRQAEATARAEQAAAAKVAGLRQALESQQVKAKADEAAQQAASEQAGVEHRDAEAAVAVAEAVVAVLGFKGVRAHLLDRALRRIEVVANRHLGTLRPGMQLALAATTEKKTGGTSDAISLRVVVRAGEAARPYASLSGGERRRVDVALLLALADVAGSASGQAGGTLWLDEVFDALDSDGAEAVARVVDGLAATRPVVLITHATALTEAVRAARSIRLTAPGAR